MLIKILLLFQGLWIYECYFPQIVFLLFIVKVMKQGGWAIEGEFPLFSSKNIYILIYSTSWGLKLL